MRKKKRDMTEQQTDPVAIEDELEGPFSHSECYVEDILGTEAADGRDIFDVRVSIPDDPDGGQTKFIENCREYIETLEIDGFDVRMGDDVEDENVVTSIYLSVEETEGEN